MQCFLSVDPVLCTGLNDMSDIYDLGTDGAPVPSEHDAQSFQG